MTEKEIYKTCPFQTDRKGEYPFALCNTTYCELWNKEGNCCSFYMIATLINRVEEFIDKF